MYANFRDPRSRDRYVENQNAAIFVSKVVSDQLRDCFKNSYAQ